jgi:hypothetical protein
MDEPELIDEVLQLTLACQKGDATPEERARLERLLADNPAAIPWYLRIVDDTLTLMDIGAARDTASGNGLPIGNWEPPTVSKRRESHFLFAERPPRMLWTIAALACGFLVALGISLYYPKTAPTTEASVADSHAARIVELSNVEWASGSRKYDEWSPISNGETLKFTSGWIDVFFTNGAELLIEGPADVRFDSPQKVFASKGKLAARVGPSAVGFRVETPRANVIDRGTEFGLSVDGNKQTSVVVYKGIVDLDVVGTDEKRRRLATGEAMSVDHAGQLSRITTVESTRFLEPPQLRLNNTRHRPLIQSVYDSISSLKTSKYYRVITHGFREDCLAYVDRPHEWNGVDERGLPPFLVGGDYVMTFNDDKITNEIEIALEIARPAYVYVLMDVRVPPPAWLKRDFIDTKWKVGSDECHPDKNMVVEAGAGKSIDQVFSVWRRKVTAPSTVILGALNAPPTTDVKAKRSMYGIVVTPLHEDRTDF